MTIALLIWLGASAAGHLVSVPIALIEGESAKAIGACLGFGISFTLFLLVAVK